MIRSILVIRFLIRYIYLLISSLKAEVLYHKFPSVNLLVLSHLSEGNDEKKKGKYQLEPYILNVNSTFKVLILSTLVNTVFYIYILHVIVGTTIMDNQIMNTVDRQITMYVIYVYMWAAVHHSRWKIFVRSTGMTIFLKSPRLPSTILNLLYYTNLRKNCFIFKFKSM